MGPTDLEPLIQDYLNATCGTITYPLRNEVLAAVTALDRYYWDQVLIRANAAVSVNGKELLFSDEDRLFIDIGLIDPRLVPDADADFVTDLQAALAVKNERVLYLTQWLSFRYRQKILLHELDDDDLAAEERMRGESSLCRRLKEARIKIYEMLRPLFETLPGVSPEVVEQICGGKLDLQAELLWLEVRTGTTPRAAVQLNKLDKFRASIFERLKTHASRAQHLQHIDNLRKFNESIRAELESSLAVSSAARSTRPALSGLAEHQSTQFLSSEIKLIKMLLQLGTTDSGIRRSHSVLLCSESLIEPSDITATLKQAREADPRLPLDLTFLIAPYTGAGFFEWDRDTIVIPLVSTKDKEDSVVGGLATYRILIDKLQQSGRLMRRYSKMRAVSGSAMRAAFIRDYRRWVLKTCRGWRGGLERKVYDFFKNQIGHRPSSIVIPIELLNLTRKETVELLKLCRKRINAGQADWNDYYNLAVAYWSRGNFQLAYENLHAAARIGPDRGMLLFSLGVLSYKLELPVWRRFFKACSALAPNSIWQVYAKEYLSEG